ncbi:MAG: hypothetical protein U1C57_04040 [Candidatus Doudnabacteria bacterium]|nr:hypothetical protein [bacterium]MDZ4244248.1 hypothetical protein [Candidatus Doudnabacteria bacterium]
MRHVRQMASFATIVALLALVAVPLGAYATVDVTAGPTSLVPDPILVKANSAPIPLFEFTVGQDAGETLSSVSVLINQNTTTTVSGSDLANVSVYEDDGNGAFSSASDTLVGTQASVLIASSTMVAITPATLASGKFFVTLSTGAAWSGTDPADSITVALTADQIVSSTGPLSSTVATTNSITADTSGSTLQSAIAKNTGGTATKEAGDTVELTFSESTNKPVITSVNISSYLTLNNGHSFLDETGALGGAAWNVEGTILTITLSGTTTSTIPSVSTSDVVTVADGSGLADIAGNPAAGAQAITGSFSGTTSDGGGTLPATKCANGLTNGRLYKLKGEATAYLAAACRLKPFRGAAVFHARGHKFQNIIELDSLPSNVSISQTPVLPEAGSLIKGKDATVWFMTKAGKRRGFVSAEVFHGLGFKFGQIKAISDEDLGTIAAEMPITTTGFHPDGALLKCGNSATVFQIIGGSKFPFTSAEAFQNRGHSFDNIISVDCGRFKYLQGAPVSN